LYSFEGIQIYGVEEAEQYLTNQYGNWGKIPPEEKRISHHDYYLDLLTPWQEYVDSNKKERAKAHGK